MPTSTDPSTAASTALITSSTTTPRDTSPQEPTATQEGHEPGTVGL